jgi:hypothetical protein
MTSNDLRLILLTLQGDLFDHLVRAGEQHRRHLELERSRDVRNWGADRKSQANCDLETRCADFPIDTQILAQHTRVRFRESTSAPTILI